MQQFDIPIIHKTYELFKEIHAAQKIIPKMERFTIWQSVENTIIEILKSLIQVGYMPQEARLTQLQTLGVNVDLLRVFLRLSIDIKALPSKKAIPLQEKLDEIGRMLGGWIKSIKQK